jgi:hypothetical protein
MKIYQLHARRSLRLRVTQTFKVTLGRLMSIPSVFELPTESNYHKHMSKRLKWPISTKCIKLMVIYELRNYDSL